MLFLKMFLAFLALSLAAASYVASSKSGTSGSGDDTVITDPGSGSGSDSGTVDRTDPVSPPAETTQPASTTAHLSWYAPLSRENGDPLLVGEITGYRIRIEGQGYTSTQERNVSGTSTELTLDLPGAGTYWFSIAAVDINGIYSDYSSKVSKTIN